MKRIYQYLPFLLLFSVFACTEEVPNPALPDLSGIPEETIKPFAVLSPSSGLSLNIKRGEQTLAIDWADAPGATTYEWVADEMDGDFSSPLLVIPSANTGKASNLTLTYTQIYEKLGEAGVDDGEKVDLKWSVRAKTGNSTRLATSPRLITFQRGGVTFTVYVPANTPSDYDVYLAGEFGFFTGSNWQQPGSNASLKLNKNSDGTYSIILPVPVNQSFNYKYFIAPSGASTWNHGERRPNANGSGSTGDGTDRSFTFTGTNDNVIQTVSFWEGYDYEYLLFKLTAPANTPVNRDVFIAGELDKVGGAPGAWQQPGTNARLKMTRSSNTEFFIVFPKPTANFDMQYKYFVSSTAAPTWDNGENGGNRNLSFTGTNTVVADQVASWSGI